MNILYLGTAAYEGVPAPYCKCRVCRESFRTGGRALRSRSQAIIDGELLIDFNADTLCHSLRYRIEWENIGDCLITHSHSDHLYPMDLEILSDPISHEHRILHFYSAKDGYKKIADEIARHKMQNRRKSPWSITEMSSILPRISIKYSPCARTIRPIRRPSFMPSSAAESAFYMRTIREFSRKRTIRF